MIIISIRVYIINMNPQPSNTGCCCNQIMNRMDDIERKLDTIMQKLDGNVIATCDKMNTHIDFVNGVYDTVKIPLNYITNTLHKMANPFSKSIELPDSSESNVL